jgi:hypothetical protein
MGLLVLSSGWSVKSRGLLCCADVKKSQGKKTKIMSETLRDLKPERATNRKSWEDGEREGKEGPGPRIEEDAQEGPPNKRAAQAGTGRHRQAQAGTDGQAGRQHLPRWAR